MTIEYTLIEDSDIETLDFDALTDNDDTLEFTLEELLAMCDPLGQGVNT